MAEQQQGGKYGSLIRQAKQSKPDDQLDGKPDSQITSLLVLGCGVIAR